jgi:acyl-CoA synthetase (NDP forming)
VNIRFGRLLKPATIAVFGGDWAAAVIQQCRQAGFKGDIWPVHPSREELAGQPCFASIDDLPGVPDASFIGVNKEGTIDIVRGLSAKNAGGAICFASGFSEAAAQDADAESRQARLIDAAGDMPVIGPNCYGLINYLDNIAIWPDQHGGKWVKRGVAIITQSSNIAINLTMQQRGLPVAYILTAGNQAQTTLAELAEAVISDERVTALGLHIEGFSDIRAFESLAQKAYELGKRIVVLKTGVTPLSRVALLSHTRSLSGNDAAASAFLERLNMKRVQGLGEFIETLKVLNSERKSGGTRVLSMSCSGGEAALLGDVASSVGLRFPPLNNEQIASLQTVLGQQLTLANPLDYHTNIWNELDAMKGMVSAMLQSYALPDSATISANDQAASIGDVALLVLDIPRADRCAAPSWHGALSAFVEATQHWQGLSVVLATLPENMPESVVEELMSKGVVALCGLRDGLLAIHNAAWLEAAAAHRLPNPVWLADQRTAHVTGAVLSLVDCAGIVMDRPSARRASQEAWGLIQTARPGGSSPRQLDECTAKRWLSRFGVAVPVNVRLSFADVRSSRQLSRALDKASPTFSYPVVAKGLGVVHKSEANAIELGIDNRRELERAIQRIDCAGGCLIEEYVEGAVAELLVSVILDPVHGLLMTISAGGITTEILDDSVHCLLPATRDEFDRRLLQLRCAPLLNGFRGRAVVNRKRLLNALDSVQQAALQLGERLVELEINPLLCSAEQCTAVDAFVSVHDLPVGG